MKNIKNWKIFILPAIVLVVLAGVIFSKTSLQKGTFSGLNQNPIPVTITLPDLQPLDLSRSLKSKSMRVSIRNSGTRASDPFRVCGYLYTVTQTLGLADYQAVLVDGLDVNEEKVIYMSLPQVVSPRRFATVNIDCTSLVSESNESNNSIRYDFPSF